MTDFYPILKRAVIALPENTLAARRNIYARAREALERQLKSIAPPLQDADILSEQLALEDTIRKIESEFVNPTEMEQRNPFQDKQSFGRLEPSQMPPPSIDENNHLSAYRATPTGTDVFPTLPPITRLETEPQNDLEKNNKALPENAPLKSLLKNKSILENKHIQDVLTNIKNQKRYPSSPQRPSLSLDKRRPASDHSKGLIQRNKVFIGIALLAMVLVGGLALATREKPGLYSATPPSTVTSSPEASKTEGRLASTDQAETKPANSENSPAVLPVLARAFMVLEVPNAAPNQYQGSILWEFSPDAGNKPDEKVIRAKIDFPNGGIKVDFSLARNLDKTLDVSHTALIVFETTPALGVVQEISAIEWRERESQAGSILQGAVVPVQDNFFTLGLDKSEAALAKNLDLFRTQKWMVFEMRFANGRRGAVLLEKGATGERVIMEALKRWQ